MNRKSILALNLTSILLVLISLFGCGNTSRNNTYRQDRIPNDGIRGGYVDGSGTAGNITEATKDRIGATADSIRYSAANVKNDIINAGYTLKESPKTKINYFNGNETDYLLGGDVVRIYEYNSTADLEGDINRIAPNGMTINGTNANYKTRPYYYRKGNTLIVYEGTEPAYIDEFGRLYGNALRP